MELKVSMQNKINQTNIIFQYFIYTYVYECVYMHIYTKHESREENDRYKGIYAKYDKGDNQIQDVIQHLFHECKKENAGSRKGTNKNRRALKRRL